MQIKEIHIYEVDRKAEAVLDNGSIVLMDYLQAEREFTKMFENKGRTTDYHIFKFNTRRV